MRKKSGIRRWLLFFFAPAVLMVALSDLGEWKTSSKLTPDSIVPGVGLVLADFRLDFELTSLQVAMSGSSAQTDGFSHSPMTQRWLFDESEVEARRLLNSGTEDTIRVFSGELRYRYMEPVAGVGQAHLNLSRGVGIRGSGGLFFDSESLRLSLPLISRFNKSESVAVAQVSFETEAPVELALPNLVARAAGAAGSGMFEKLRLSPPVKIAIDTTLVRGGSRVRLGSPGDSSHVSEPSGKAWCIRSFDPVRLELRQPLGGDSLSTFARLGAADPILLDFAGDFELWRSSWDLQALVGGSPWASMPEEHSERYWFQSGPSRILLARKKHPPLDTSVPFVADSGEVELVEVDCPEGFSGELRGWEVAVGKAALDSGRWELSGGLRGHRWATGEELSTELLGYDVEDGCLSIPGELVVQLADSTLLAGVSLFRIEAEKVTGKLRRRAEGARSVYVQDAELSGRPLRFSGARGEFELLSTRARYSDSSGLLVWGAPKNAEQPQLALASSWMTYDTLEVKKAPASTAIRGDVEGLLTSDLRKVLKSGLSFRLLRFRGSAARMDLTSSINRRRLQDATRSCSLVSLFSGDFYARALRGLERARRVTPGALDLRGDPCFLVLFPDSMGMQSGQPDFSALGSKDSSVPLHDPFRLVGSRIQIDLGAGRALAERGGGAELLFGLSRLKGDTLELDWKKSRVRAEGDVSLRIDPQTFSSSRRKSAMPLSLDCHELRLSFTDGDSAEFSAAAKPGERVGLRILDFSGHAGSLEQKDGLLSCRGGVFLSDGTQVLRAESARFWVRSDSLQLSGRPEVLLAFDTGLWLARADQVTLRFDRRSWEPSRFVATSAEDPVTILGPSDQDGRRVLLSASRIAGTRASPDTVAPTWSLRAAAGRFVTRFSYGGLSAVCYDLFFSERLSRVDLQGSPRLNLVHRSGKVTRVDAGRLELRLDHDLTPRDVFAGGGIIAVSPAWRAEARAERLELSLRDGRGSMFGAPIDFDVAHGGGSLQVFHFTVPEGDWP